jgi:hypothetical protein
MSVDVPDLHYFCGRGGKDVIPLWRDSDCTLPNVTDGVLEILSEEYGQTVTAEQLFAYCYALLAQPNYVDEFWEELVVPGPRVPLTRDASLFNRAVETGEELARLHTFGHGLTHADRAPESVPQGRARIVEPIGGTGSQYPEDYEYRSDTETLRVGSGEIRPVRSEVMEFGLSGLEVVPSWLGYRMKERAGRESSELDKVRLTNWSQRFSEELLELLWVIEHTLELFDANKDLLTRIIGGTCFDQNQLPQPAEDGIGNDDDIDPDVTGPTQRRFEL